MAEQLHSASRNAVWGGILLSIVGNLHWQDMLQTIILAAIGTVASFGTSALLKKLSARRKRS